MRAPLRGATCYGRWLLVICAVVTISSSSVTARNVGKGTCVAIYDASRGTTWRSDEASCAKRLSPASTFKIPHALVALETAAIREDSVERWDGTRFTRQAVWEQNHTLRTAIVHSVVWFFQRTATRIGPARMQGFLRQFDYGNADTSGDPITYWLNGTLRISPNEQLEFLKRFFTTKLPVKRQHIAFVRRALIQEPGTVRNSMGLHAVEGYWDSHTQLFAKTGATLAADGTGVTWLVGALTRSGHTHVFVSASWNSGAVEPLEATRHAIAAFIQRGLLEPAKSITPADIADSASRATHRALQ